MDLTLIAKDNESGKNGCPAFYDLEEAPQDCVIQGHLLDPATAANLLNVLPGEGAVRIKKQILIDALARLGS
jgi:hypothetical protein